jgi:ATP-dependent Clp protease ATP-binding subunit ClpA
MVRIDMSEFMEKHAVSRRLRASCWPATRKAAISPKPRRPCSVILLEEVEKAHPDVQHPAVKRADVLTMARAAP